MIHFVINPVSRSGKGLRIWQKKIEPFLKKTKAEYRVHLSEKRLDVTSIIRKILEENQGRQKIVVVGGDGTLNDAIQGIDDFDRVVMGLFPTGSSNDFIRDVPKTKGAEALLSKIVSSENGIPLDIGYVTAGDFSRRFAVSSGTGFDAAVCEMSVNSRIKKTLNRIGLGKLTYYAIAANRILKAPKVNATVEFDDGRKETMGRLLFACAMVHKFEGGGFMFCPDASWSDGQLDMCVAHGMNPLLIAPALPMAFFGKHLSFPGVKSFRFRKAAVTLEKPLWIHTDGEVYIQASSMEFGLCDKKLEFIF